MFDLDPKKMTAISQWEPAVAYQYALETGSIRKLDFTLHDWDSIGFHAGWSFERLRGA